MRSAPLIGAAVSMVGVGFAFSHGCGSPSGVRAQADAGPSDASAQLVAARAAIRHIIIISQENRSFDHYFGTFPGADGIPLDGGVPSVCLPLRDAATLDGASCISPYHTTNDTNFGTTHTELAFAADYADGGMNGFVATAAAGVKKVCAAQPKSPACAPIAIRDVMSYHTDQEIPNYWAYAKNFTLEDHMFEPVKSTSLTDHLYMVSAWSAKCTPASDPTACVSDLTAPGAGRPGSTEPEYAWTDITFLLHQYGVTWNYFVAGGKEPDCDDGEMTCDAGSQSFEIPSSLNVLPWFDDVRADGEVGNVEDTSQFFDKLKNGTLASVNWLIPSQALSEHPPALVTRGQAYVTGIINAVMQSAYWESTVIFLTWDDWGGFYDHEKPVAVDGNGYGFRVPGLTISPWVKRAQIDRQVLSHDAYLRFIEDVFLDGARLDPKHDGRADDRPTVREDVGQLGDLLLEFDFNQAPNPPLLLSPCPTPVDTTYSDAGPCTLE